MLMTQNYSCLAFVERCPEVHIYTNLMTNIIDLIDKSFFQIGYNVLNVTWAILYCLCK